jgi:hypothetical protein
MSATNFWKNSPDARPFRNGEDHVKTALVKSPAPIAIVLLLATQLGAQETKPEASPPAPAETPVPHRFWDHPNQALFAGVAAARALDYASTRHFRNKGVDEVFLTNSIVDNKPLFGVIQAAGVGISIAVSYLFHRTGHHTIERWVSAVHISVGTAGAIRNFGLEPKPASGAGL